MIYNSFRIAIELVSMSCATGNALSHSEGLLLPFSCGRRLALSVAEGGWGMRGN